MKDLFLEKYGEKVPLIKCLDHGFVRLIDFMPRCIEDTEESADYTIAEAARCSYQRGTKTIADDKTLIRYLMRHNHTSPFEMIEFKFQMKLPIFTARQMIRHRTASLNELSGRYSEMPEEFYTPDIDNYRTQDSVNKQGSAGTMSYQNNEIAADMFHYNCLGSFEIYKNLLENGLVREQARMVLPLSSYTEWYWKIDLKNLLHFLDLRCDRHAQWEIQQYANTILELIKPIVPWAIEAWEDYSPYRGGMMLTRCEIEKIQSMLKHMSVDMIAGETICPPRTIESLEKLENKEWAEKADILGLDWDGYDFEENEE